MLQSWIGEEPHRQHERRPAQAEGQAAKDVARPVFAEVDSADAIQQQDQGRHDPSHCKQGSRETSDSEADDEQRENPAEENDVPAGKAEAARMADHVDQIRRWPRTLDDPLDGFYKLKVSDCRLILQSVPSKSGPRFRVVFAERRSIVYELFRALLGL